MAIKGSFNDESIADDSHFMGRIRWIVEEISNDGITQKHQLETGKISSIDMARNLTRSRGDAARAIRKAVIDFLAEFDWPDDDE